MILRYTYLRTISKYKEDRYYTLRIDDLYYDVLKDVYKYTGSMNITKLTNILELAFNNSVSVYTTNLELVF